MEKLKNSSSFISTYHFVSGAYFITFFITLMMLFKDFNSNIHPFALFFNLILYIALFFIYIYIHKKRKKITLSALLLFWTVTAINVCSFIFQPLNEGLFLFAFIPIIIFISIRNRKLLLINSALFYTVLGATVIYNLHYIKNSLDSEFLIVFVFFNMLMAFFGIYYQKTMHKLIHELEESNRINTFLLKETHHRVKNNLNLLSSILALQLDLNDPKEKEFFFANQQRIESIAKLHEILYKKEALESISLKDYIEQILLLMQKESLKKIEYKLFIKQEVLNLDTLIYLGIIITEVVLNSIKHNPNSKIELVFNFSKKSEYILKICENCYLSIEILKKNFGFELLNMAAQNLYGTFKLEKEGGKSCYTISFPLKADDV